MRLFKPPLRKEGKLRENPAIRGLEMEIPRTAPSPAAEKLT
jgi:hypothetical protein